MTKSDRYILWLVAVASVFGLFLPSASNILGGDTNFDSLDVTDGYKVDGTTVIDGSGNFSTGSSNLTVGASGTSIDQIACATATWDPASVSSSTAPAALDIANSGAALGDVALASFDSATSTTQWTVDAKVTGAATTTIYLYGTSGAAVNLSTSTARVCTVQF